MDNVVLILSEINIGGAEKVVVDLCCQYKQMDLNVILVVLGKKKNNFLDEILEKKNIKCLYLEFKSGDYLKNYIKFRDNLKKLNPKVIHINLEYKNSIIWALTHKVKTIITIHTQPYRINNLLNRILFKLIAIKRGTIFIGVSKSVSKDIEKVFGIKKQKIQTIYNPIKVCDTVLNTNRNSTIELVHVGRFAPVKNHELLIDSFYLALQKFPTLKLSLFGEGETEEEIKKKVNRLNITDKVVFKGSCSNVMEQLLNMDIFILTSVSETLSVAILEAMTVGLPIIATNVGGVGEIVTNNGILINNCKAEEIADAIIKLASDSDLRTKLGSNSLENVKKYDIKTIAQQYVEVYEA